MSSSTLLQCSESQRDAIFKEYGKTPETVIQDIKTVKGWMTKSKDLPEVPDERVIESFLLLNKFDMDKAKKKLEMYYRVRSIIPELYNKNPNDPSVQKIMDMLYFMPLPKLTSELYRVIIIKATDTNVDHFDVNLYLAHTLNMAEIRLREDYNLSEIHVYDLSGLQLGHFTKFTPGVIKKGIFVLEKVFSNRSKGIHYLNAPRYIGPFVTVLKLFMKPKLAGRIFVHKNMESLYKVIPKEILPEEYGGNERALRDLNEEWKSKFLEYASLFEHLKGFTAKKGEGVQQHELLESNTSLKQLNVD